MEKIIADFVAKASLHHGKSGKKKMEEFEKSRIILSDKHLLIVSKNEKVTTHLKRIFDVRKIEIPDDIRNLMEDGKKYQTDHLVVLYKLATYYYDTYDFTREIEILGQVYYKDSDRLKNLRLLIINSLNDKKLIEKLQTILIKL